jgi:DNA-binding NtrC family response regulator
VRELGAKMGWPGFGLSAEARKLLLAHSWPGNIRELQNAIERALILAKGGMIAAEHLGIVPGRTHDPTMPPVTAPPKHDTAAFVTIAAQEKRVIAEALQRTHGHKARAAALLGLTRFQLYSRLKRYQIDVAGWIAAEQVTERPPARVLA